MALTVAMGLVARMVLMLPLVAMVLEVVVTVVVVTVLGEKALVVGMVGEQLWEGLSVACARAWMCWWPD